MRKAQNLFTPVFINLAIIINRILGQYLVITESLETKCQRRIRQMRVEWVIPARDQILIRQEERNPIPQLDIECLKADFQSSHEAPRSSLRVLASN